MIYTFLATILVLGILVFVHELGHFLAAKKLGIRVLTFSLGFGPKLVGFKRNETLYQISAIPLGGYVKMAGEDAFDDGYIPKPGDFMATPWWGRVLLALAGPMANILTAFLVLFLVFATGVRVPDYAPLVGAMDQASLGQRLGLKAGDRLLTLNGRQIGTWHQMDTAWDSLMRRADRESLDLAVLRNDVHITIRIPSREKQQFFEGLSPIVTTELGEVTIGAPAYQAGLAKGDLILAVAGHPVATWDQMRAIIYQNAEKELRLLVKRQSDTLQILVTPIPMRVPGQGTVGVIGISPPSYGSYSARWPVHQALLMAIDNTVTTTGRIYLSLAQLATKPKIFAKQLGGMVMVGQLAGESARKGLSDLLQLIAMLSITLFVLNLLPLPVLDGGVIFFCLVEGIRRRPLPAKAQAVIQQVGISLLVMLVALTLFNDFARIVGRHQAIKGKTGIEQHTN